MSTLYGICLVCGFILTAGAGDIQTALIGLPLLAVAAWGFNRIDKQRNKSDEKGI